MATAGLTCEDCGSSNIIEDNFYAQSQVVCRDCGSVVSEGRLVTDTSELTAFRYSQTTAVAKKPCQNQKLGLQRVHALCRILRVNIEVEELAEVYFRKAYVHSNFINVSLQKKEALVGCCVLVSCRLRNWPVTMGTISGLLETDPVLVGVVYHALEKTLNIEVTKAMSITDLLESHAQDYKISHDHVPDELAENPKDLAKRAVALVELAADSWIVTGRHPVPIMMASIFLAWQSLKPIKTRMKFRLGKFCQLTKVPYNRTAQTRVNEIKEVLFKLGKEIPWYRGEVTPVRVMRDIEDILRHRYSLLRRALRTHEATLAVEGQHSEGLLDSQTNELTTESGPSEPRTPDHVAVEERKRKAETQEPDKGLRNPCNISEPCNELTQDIPAPNWGKRLLFAPPCVKRPKRRRVEAPLQSDVNGDEDISDSEIDSYIRTPQEVRDLENSLLSSEDGQGE